MFWEKKVSIFWRLSNYAPVPVLSLAVPVLSLVVPVLSLVVPVLSLAVSVLSLAAPLLSLCYCYCWTRGQESDHG